MLNGQVPAPSQASPVSTIPLDYFTAEMQSRMGEEHWQDGLMSFHFEPLDDGKRTRFTHAARLHKMSIMGWMMRLMFPGMMKQQYHAMTERILEAMDDGGSTLPDS